LKKRILGNSGIEVSELCLGTGTFGGRGLYKSSGEVTQDEANDIVSAAIDAGINFFDTAETYSEGLAEQILGKALGGKRKNAIIVTKAAPKRPGTAEKGGLTRSHIMKTCESSLKNLGTDYIDIYELHIFDPSTPLEETLEAMNDLIKQGKVRQIGCSNFSGWQLMKALSLSEFNKWARLTALEAKYSLLLRETENELIPLCVDQNIGVIVYSPLHGGFLTGKYTRNKPWPVGTRFPSKDDMGPWSVEFEQLYSIIDELNRISAERSISVSSAALNYLLQKPAVSSLIIGVRNIRQLESNLSATGWSLSPDEISFLDKLSQPAALYPYSDQQANFLFSDL